MPHRPSPLRIHLALFTVAFLFSANYVLLKIGMRDFSPLSFIWLRTSGAAVMLAFLSRNSRVPIPPADSRRIVLYSLLGVVLNGVLFIAGLNFTTVQVAAVLITTIPVFALLAAIVLGFERTTASRFAGIMLAAAGALLVVGGEGLHGTARSLLGAVMVVANCLSYAMYLVLSKPLLERLSVRRVVARMFAAGSVLMFPVCAWSLWHERWSDISPRGWITLCVVTFGPTVLAYLLNAWALQHAESSFVAVYTYVQPVLATLMGALFLGETIRGIVILAALLIFTGVWLAGRASAGPVPE